MENAAKALMIAAGVLIGIMILSLGVYLFYALSQYTTGAQEQMEMNAVSKFNTQFTKYLDNPSLTIQDVITAANLAYQNNTDNGLDISDAGGATYYVTVNAYLEAEGRTIQHLEKDIMEKRSEWLSGDEGYQYNCTSTDIKTSSETGRVYEINFR